MMTGKDGVRWAVQFFKEKGIHLQPNEENMMVVLWEQHLQSLEDKKTESLDNKDSPKKIESDVKTGKHKGFVTG